MLNVNQSGFQPSDSCEYQVLSIIHNVYAGFDQKAPLEVRSCFLDISKAFAKVGMTVLFIRWKLWVLQVVFLGNRYQRVTINGQTSDWLLILAGVPQGSILGPLLFLIYINDLPDSLESLAKLFADNISLFSIVYDTNVSARQLSNDLQKVTVWAHKCKMIFNPDISKQAQEVAFSRKTDKVNHMSLGFNDIPVAQSSHQKHLGLYLDEKLNFSHHMKEIISKVNKGIGITRKLRSILPRNALLTIYKAFIRPNIDYCEFIYDQPHNESFCNNLEKLQYNAALAIIDAIKGTSKLKIYEELGFESLKFRRWMRRLCGFYKIKTRGHPEYLYTN